MSDELIFSDDYKGGFVASDDTVKYNQKQLNYLPQKEYRLI